MIEHITTELVEQIARDRYESARELADEPYPTWVEAHPLEKHAMREAVVGNLRYVIPALVGAGWVPPVGGAA